MSHSSIPTPAGSNLPDRQSSLRLKNAGLLTQASAADFLTVLREALADENRSAEAIFRAIADAACVLTAAGGTALALRSNGAIVCRARSGEMAPPLGSALNIDSGISGECIRTSRLLRCDDAEADARVEPEVCRLLGIRSIVVVPVRGRNEVVGVLEAFSAETFAFGDERIHILESLAETAEAAYARQFNATDSAVIAAADAPKSISPVAAPALLPTAIDDQSAKHKHHYWILIGALAMLLVASGVVWRTWHEPAAENSATSAVARAGAVSGETSRAVESKALPSKPSASVTNHPPDRSHGKVLLQNAAKVEATEDSGTVRSASNSPATIASPVTSRGSTRSSGDSGAAVDPPTVVLASTDHNDAKLADLASTAAPLPAMDLRVSQGVVEAKVISKVDPVYPRDALSEKISGTVTIEATISERGTVDDAKVLRGEPALAAAALAAVRQWRYNPCLLDNKPVAVQKTITVIFKAQ
ncbi:MAG: TonB family protein [Candidatus Sulfotelmatobacter sp.]